MEVSEGTLKETPLLGPPDTVTTTFPVVVAGGTVATMLVLLQLVVTAVRPLNFAVLAPLVAPKLEPAIVTDAPGKPEVGVSPVMLGLETTEKGLPLLSTPLDRTTTLPVVAPLGTVTTMLVADHVVAVAVVPLNFTVLVL